MATNTDKSFLQKIWEKGILQIVLSYLVGAWALLQFIDWLVNRYAISPIWTDIALVFFLTLLPSVLLFTYFNDKGNNKQWQRLEKYVIPSNLILALLVLVLLFSGRDLSAKNEKITVTNENGEEVKRLVPKQQFLRRLLYLPAQVKIPEKQWLQIAYPVLQKQDMEQDNRLSGVNPVNLYNSIRRFGYDFGDKLPLSIQRKLADYNYCDFIVSTSISYDADNYSVELDVADAKDGKAFYQKTYKGSNFFHIIDQFSEDFRKHLYPDQPSKQIDLPVDEYFTANEKALACFADSYIADDFENDKEKALELLEKAVEEDPNFTAAYINICGVHQNLRNKKEMQESLEKAMRGVHALPERMQLNLKYYYFFLVEEDRDKAIALLEMWKDLFPSDIVPFSRLINLHQGLLQYEQAKAYAEEALEAGHTGWIFLRLAYLNRAQGKLDIAESYYLKYIEAYPDKADETLDLGYLYRDQGAFEKAKKHFEKMQLLKPNDHNIYGALAKIELCLLEFDKADKLYAEALRKAKLPQDSASVFQWMQNFHIWRGQNEQAIALMNERFDKLEAQFYTSAQLLDELLWPNTFVLYGDCGKMGQLTQRSTAYVEKYMSDNEFKKCLIELLSALFGGTNTEIMAAFDKCGVIYMESASPNEKILAEAFLAEARGETEKAIRYFEGIVKEVPDYFFKFRLVSLYLKNNQADEAELILNDLLKVNAYLAKGHFLMAQVKQQQGKMDEALAAVEQTLKIWEKADACFIPKKEAEAFEKTLTEQ